MLTVPILTALLLNSFFVIGESTTQSLTMFCKAIELDKYRCVARFIFNFIKWYSSHLRCTFQILLNAVYKSGTIKVVFPRDIYLFALPTDAYHFEGQT